MTGEQEVYENVEEMLKIEDNNLLTAARLRLADAFWRSRNRESERTRVSCA